MKINDKTLNFNLASLYAFFVRRVTSPELSFLKHILTGFELIHSYINYFSFIINIMQEKYFHVLKLH